MRRWLDWVIARVFNVFFPLLTSRCFLFCISEATQGDSRGDDKVPQWRLHQVPAVHTARQHVWVQQADAALWVVMFLEKMSRLFQIISERSPSSDKRWSSWLYWGRGGREPHTACLLLCCQSRGDVSQQFCLDKLFLWMHQMVNSASQCWYFYLIPLFHRVTNK